MIDENKIIQLIGVQLQKIIDKDDKYKTYDFTLTNELQFVKDKKNGEKLKNNPKQIFVVVKFLPATLNFGQTLMPIIVNAIAEKNKLDICYNLLIEYAEAYNLEFNVDETIKQYYSTPSVLSNFNEIGDGYRSLINMTGTFQISENSNFFEITYNSETVPSISQSISYDVQLESNVFYGKNDRTTSRGRVGTFVLNVTMYLTKDGLPNDAFKATKDCDVSFDFIIKFKNGVVFTETCKLANFAFEQNIGEIPVCTLTFTN